MKPICVKCKKFYRPKQNGFCFTEGQVGAGWAPYKAWMGDLWECNGCGHQLISGVGSRPLTEHYLHDFETVRASFKAGQLQIDDC
jgi:hypothetical protein